MPNINWEEIEGKYGGNFKDYAPAGKFTATFDKVSNRASSTGTIWMEFKPADGDKYAYPKISHPISFNNDAWRQWHMRCLFELFGATKDQAKKAVENCEAKEGKEAIAKMYETSMKKLLEKKPTTEIEVWQEGDYMRADFTAGVRMNRPPVEEKAEDILATGEEVSDEEVPF